MKKLISLLSILTITLITVPDQWAQTQQGDYMNLEYFMIDHSEVLHFESQIDPVLTRLQQARVDAGALKEWLLYKVNYPSTQNPVYNYVIVSICNDICSFEDIPDIVADQFSADELNHLLDRYNELIFPVKAELWRINNRVTRSDDSIPARYLSMDYMNVSQGMEYVYQMMEDEIARPLHEQRMENERMEGWEIYSLIVPGGTTYGYNFATGNHFNELRDIEFGFTEEMIRQSHPNTDINEFFENIQRTRDPVRIEIWELISYVN